MIEISKPIPDIQVIHQRTDDFQLVFEIEDVDGNEKDVSQMEPTWVIQDGEDFVLTISGDDFTLNGNVIKVVKPASDFAGMSKIVKYRHRFFDSANQTTYFRGIFLLE